MTGMKQSLEVSSVKRDPNRTSETSAPLEDSAGFWREAAIVLYEKFYSRPRDKLLH